MSTSEKISPDDPRLTAYALGEMEPAEHSEFEKLLKQDAAARVFVAEIKRATHRIGVALAREDVPQVGAIRLEQAAIIAGRNFGKLDGGPLRSPEVPNLRRWLAKLFQFPQLYFTISGLAAACFAIGFIIWQANYREQPQMQYTEVDLTKFVPANAENVAEAKTEPEGGQQPASAESAAGVVALENGGNDNAFLAVTSEPLSTFPIKTGAAAYANVRHLIGTGRHPPRGAVRIEELVNYFPYQYAPPETKNVALPFAAHLEVASAPWAPAHRLVRIGLKGREAQKLSVAAAGGPLPPIAKDVKLQVEFNPSQVQAYRLIGYENRMPRKEDFNNDRMDAGEIQAGHTVTALYEVVPAGVEWKPENGADQLKYQTTESSALPPMAKARDGRKVAVSDDLLTLRLHYKEPDGEAGKQMEFPLRDTGRTFDQASADFKFAASVAAFGMILRDSPHKGAATLAHVTEWAQAGLVNDAGGYRKEFVGLVGQAERLAHN